MTESDPGVESEKASDGTLGKPGQRHEAGKAFGCSVDVGELCFVLRSVRSREADPAIIKSLAPPVLWLACEVQSLNVLENTAVR